MKYGKIFFCGLIALTLIATPLTGCNNEEKAEDTSATQAATSQSEGTTEAQVSNFSYSEGIDENGYWQGITALDNIEMFDYKGIEIAKDAYEISDDDVQTQVDSILTSYATSEEVKDRKVVDGDTVNIDYVGSVDGVEFENGSTDGAGTEVTIGVTTYIDDFLEQLIDHKPGDTFNVEVTFPDEYENNPDLEGKDAVFVTTINHIVESTTPELTDAFVAENLEATYNWKTVKDMKAAISEDLKKEAIMTYIKEYLVNDVKVKSIPETMLKHQENAMVNYYEQSATSYGMELEEFLTMSAGVSSLDELVANNEKTLKEGATYSLVLQAIAENEKMTVKDEDVKSYFSEYSGTEDYSQYETQYGMPYLKQITLSQKVLDLIEENAVLK